MALIREQNPRIERTTGEERDVLAGTSDPGAREARGTTVSGAMASG